METTLRQAFFVCLLGSVFFHFCLFLAQENQFGILAADLVGKYLLFRVIIPAAVILQLIAV